jgi:holliday junction DNA helicase RuvA
MIGKLRGVVDGLDDEGVIPRRQRVGYFVAASTNTLRALPSIGAPVELLIETRAREDAIQGFNGFSAKTVLSEPAST